MKLTTILVLGAAALATPAFAQAAADTSSQAATQTAMNDNSASNSSISTDNSSASAALSSIPDTKKTYKDASRARDFQKEAETTKALNQQVASAGGLPKTQQ